MNAVDLRSAAKRLSLSRLNGTVVKKSPSRYRPINETEAYLIQDDLHEILGQTKLGEVVGHKIGCTTSVMQDFLNIRNPCAGGIFATTSHLLAGNFDYKDYRHVGVECEIAVRLCEPLGFGCSSNSVEYVAGAVDEVMPAIEIVDDRYEDYASLGAPTLIADDFFDAGCVLGNPRKDWRSLDLVSLSGQMYINGAQVGCGRGGDIMGHPFHALAWLAESFAARGKVISPGQFVLLGSVVETKWVQPGDLVEIEIDGLGKAQAQFR